MYDIETLYEAKSIEAAITQLAAIPSAIVIAGGSDVLIKVREGKLAGCYLVSIHGIPELEGVEMDESETIIIRPLTTFTHLTDHPLIQKYLPMLGNAVDQVGGPQVRNIGTIGGNICNGVTSADSTSTLFTYNAILEITGLEGKRYVPIQEFYKGPGKVYLAHHELLTGILITKVNYEKYHGHYIKYAMRKAMDIATLGCAVNCKLSEDKQTIEDVRVAFGVAGPTPMRAYAAEKAIKGQKISKALLETFGQIAVSEVNPRTSWRASKEFRLQLVQELSQRGLNEAIILSGGTVND